MVPEISTTLQVNRTSPTYGSFTILTYHLNQHLDLHTRAEWFWDKDGAQTRHGAHYGEIAVGHNVVPNPWINFRPEIHGDFAPLSDPRAQLIANEAN